jgi:hypothetical protein
MNVRAPSAPVRGAAVCVLGLMVALTATRAGAEGPVRLLCQAEWAGERALVQISVMDLFDRDLLHLVRLGLEGRIALEVALYRRRTFWFDHHQGSESRTSVVTWSRPRQAFALDGAPADPARLTLDPIVVSAADKGPHYVEVSVRLEVVTAGSLVQVARWLVQGPGAQAGGTTPSVLGRSLMSQVAADLARSATARCPVR